MVVGQKSQRWPAGLDLLVPDGPEDVHRVPREGPGCVVRGAPQTPNPKPQTPNPKPQTPNPQPQTLSPKPYTLKPKPMKVQSLKEEQPGEVQGPQLPTPEELDQFGEEEDAGFRV